MRTYIHIPQQSIQPTPTSYIMCICKGRKRGKTQRLALPKSWSIWVGVLELFCFVLDIIIWNYKYNTIMTEEVWARLATDPSRLVGHRVMFSTDLWLIYRGNLLILHFMSFYNNDSWGWLFCQVMENALKCQNLGKIEIRSHSQMCTHSSNIPSLTLFYHHLMRLFTAWQL